MSDTIQKYELMVIINNTLDEKKAEEYFSKDIVKRLKELKATITFEDFWGARGFAYKINKQTWGYYGVIQFDMDTQGTHEIKQDFNIDPNLVRFLLIKVDKKAPAPRKYTDVKKEWVAQEKEKKLNEIDKHASMTPAPNKYRRPEPRPVAAPASTTAEAPKKATATDLDSKLGKIIEDSSLDL